MAKDTYRYKLKFVPDALAEWNALDGSVKEKFRKLLKKRLNQPRTLGSELKGELRDCHKIKLLKDGYRLIYTIQDEQLLVLVLAVDKREDAKAYQAALGRLDIPPAGDKKR